MRPSGPARAAARPLSFAEALLNEVEPGSYTPMRRWRGGLQALRGTRRPCICHTSSYCVSGVGGERIQDDEDDDGDGGGDGDGDGHGDGDGDGDGDEVQMQMKIHIEMEIDMEMEMVEMVILKLRRRVGTLYLHRKGSGHYILRF